MRRPSIRPNLLAAIAAAASAVGCARPAGPLFPPVQPPIVFPSPPDVARIEYVGQLRTDRDLNPAATGWEVFTQVLSGPPAERSVSAPSGLCISPAERLYVADPPQGCVHIFDLRSRRYRAVTAAGPTPLAYPADVAVAEGRLFLTDAGRGAVDVYNEMGDHVTTWSGVPLTRPVGIAWAPWLGLLFVADAARHECVGVTPDGAERVRFGQRGSAPGELNFPTFLTADASLGIVVSDSMNFRVQRFDARGRPLGAFGKKGDGAGDFALPKGVAVDHHGRLYVADAHFENIQVFEPDGRLLLALGEEGQKPGQFWLPAKIAIDSARRLWVADSYNRRVQVFRILGEPAG